jgi:hypothetical protein
MPADDRPFDPTLVDPFDSQGYGASLKRRRQAAEGLERDVLTKVPLLYGSPGSLEPGGDPGISLARLHREELVRRNGGGVTKASGKRSDGALPFERAMTALAVLLFLFIVFAG